MNFNSTEYNLLLIATFLLLLIPIRFVRKFILVLSSFLFYCWWDFRFFFLILFYSLTAWGFGKLNFKLTKSKALIVVATSIMLIPLIYFKYFNFIISQLPFDIGEQSIVLPVGISFLSFQALGYVFDCYRRKVQSAATLLDTTLFLTFFPQLVAGPIERMQDLLPQLHKVISHFPKNVRLQEGFFFILKGGFFKFVFADNFSVFLESYYTQTYINVSGVTAWFHSLLYSLQIYCDFYGYSLIAVGSGMVLGVNLVMNFQHPYLALNPQEFWKRWHITLSTWFRDYIYLPLGGNLVSKPRLFLNLTLIMLLVGLWHGANYNFIIWGVGHGVLLATYRLMKNKIKVPDFVSWLATMFFVNLLWVPFRAPNWTALKTITQNLFNFQANSMPIANFKYICSILFLCLIAIAFDGYFSKKWKVRDLKLNIYIVLVLIFTIGFYLGPLKDVKFLYFQF